MLELLFWNVPGGINKCGYGNFKSYKNKRIGDHTNTKVPDIDITKENRLEWEKNVFRLLQRVKLSCLIRNQPIDT